jgi:hypothetical protein
VTRVAEVTAGSGYLSQSPAVLYFSAPEGTAAKSVSVRWPDGKTSTAAVKAGSRRVVVESR